jgi:murein DD-endopeptidase MepM/ murein hydrolase activator NlpD
MFSRRYTILIADRSTGVVRRITVGLRPALMLALALFSLPILIGLGARWSAATEISELRAANASLRVENGNYRATTGELTSQIQALESVINDLGTRSTLDPAQARAIQKLPAVVKARAAGGAVAAAAKAESNAVPPLSSVLSSAFITPEDTFGVLRSLLQVLESRLRHVRSDVERQEALAGATPSIWPTYGWLTGTFGGRPDPFTGEPAFHQGLDIATEKGRPVYATANGVVDSASYSGQYGNLIVLRHEFGLVTKYGHLSRFSVKTGDTVQRGQIIGYVGSTGRSTGAHLHYEVLASGKLINPLRLLTGPVPR